LQQITFSSVLCLLSTEGIINGAFELPVLAAQLDNPPMPIERFVPATIIDTHYLIIPIVH